MEETLHRWKWSYNVIYKQFYQLWLWASTGLAICIYYSWFVHLFDGTRDGSWGVILPIVVYWGTSQAGSALSCTFLMEVCTIATQSHRYSCSKKNEYVKTIKRGCIQVKALRLRVQYRMQIEQMRANVQVVQILSTLEDIHFSKVLRSSVN